MKSDLHKESLDTILSIIFDVGREDVHIYDPKVFLISKSGENDTLHILLGMRVRTGIIVASVIRVLLG